MRGNKFKRVLHVFAIFIAASIMVSACRSLPVLPPEHVLEKRLTGMMNARIAQNWSDFYDYLDADYKESMSKEKFLGINRGVLFGDFSVESIEIGPSGKDAVIVVKYDMTVMSFDVKGRKETQNWLKTDGQWYYQIKTGTPFD